MGERNINPIQNIHTSKRYKEVIFINPYRFGGGGTDDAQAFITAAGITDATQQSAIVTLVDDLKTNSLWTKMVAIYPIVGGTAFSHKFNLKDPRDADDAFRLNFVNSPTHDAIGWVGNGWSAYADTFVVPATSLSLNSTHVSVYLNASNTSDQVDVGMYESSPTPNFIQLASNIAGNYNSAVNSNSQVNLAHTNSGGFYLASRLIDTAHKAYQDGALIGTSGNVSNRLANLSIFLGGRNQGGGTVGLCSTRKQSFATIGEGLTDTEVSTLRTIVQAFQTTLGRQV